MCLTCCIGAPSSHNSIKAGNSTLHAPTRVAVTYKKCQGSTEHCTNKLTLSHVHTHARTHARRHTHVHTIANTYAPHYTAGMECCPCRLQHSQRSSRRCPHFHYRRSKWECVSRRKFAHMKVTTNRVCLQIYFLRGKSWRKQCVSLKIIQKRPAIWPGSMPW